MDNLDRDVKLARQAGMSYGRWKALQIPVVPEKKIPEGWLICAYCGKPFKPRSRRRQKYCEQFCMKLANCEQAKKRYAEKKQAEAAAGVAG